MGYTDTVRCMACHSRRIHTLMFEGVPNLADAARMAGDAIRSISSYCAHGDSRRKAIKRSGAPDRSLAHFPVPWASQHPGSGRVSGRRSATRNAWCNDDLVADRKLVVMITMSGATELKAGLATRPFSKKNQRWSITKVTCRGATKAVCDHRLRRVRRVRCLAITTHFETISTLQNISKAIARVAMKMADHWAR